MTNPQDAAELLRQLISVEVEMTKRVNSGNGRLTKPMLRRERVAVERIFRELTGTEIDEMQLHYVTNIYHI